MKIGAADEPELIESLRDAVLLSLRKNKKKRERNVGMTRARAVHDAESRTSNGAHCEQRSTAKEPPATILHSGHHQVQAHSSTTPNESLAHGPQGVGNNNQRGVAAKLDNASSPTRLVVSQTDPPRPGLLHTHIL